MAKRIDHSGCTHPRTPKGRALCRAGRPTFNPETGVLDMGTAPMIVVVPSSECNIHEAHCEMCGTINPEDEEGYTTCCNEPVVYAPCGHDHS